MREKLVLHGVRPVFPVNATHAAFRNMPIVSSAIMMHFTGICKALTEVVAHLRNVSGVIFFFPQNNCIFGSISLIKPLPHHYCFVLTSL